MDAEAIVENAIDNMINSGVRHYFKDGRVIFKTRKSPAPPWRFFSYDPRMKCALWKWALYKGVVEQTEGLSFAPSPCHDCYKVVIIPNSLKELKQLEQIMLNVCKPGFAGKCGIERRNNGRNYGGYIYCRGETESKERFNFMRVIVPSVMDMHIQHSGTYYLLKQGPPETWEITKEQLEIEAEFFKRVDTNQSDPDQTPDEIARVHALWDDWALTHG